MTNAIEALIQDALLARFVSDPRGLGVQARNELTALKTSLNERVAECFRLASESQEFNEQRAVAVKQVDDLAIFVRRLAHSITSESVLHTQALDYLQRIGKTGSPLRDCKPA